jgi:phage shock protein A
MGGNVTDDTKATVERLERELAEARAYRSKNEQYVAYDALVAINEKLSHELAESYERAAQVCDPIRAHTYASENAERYRIQDEWGRSLAKRIRALKGKPLPPFAKIVKGD